MSRCCAKPAHAATTQALSTSGVVISRSRQISALPDKPDDVLGRVHGFLRDRLCALGAVDQDGIDMSGIGDQPFHFRSDWRELFDAKFHQRILEAGKLS